MVKRYAELYLEARRSFMAEEPEQTASLLARSLLCFVSGKTQEQVVADRDAFATEEICNKMEDAVCRVLSGEPLAYVLGEWSFYGMNLYVDRNVLIPRDDTCAVTQLAIKRGLFLDQEPRILDLCTGSGCIGLAIANRVKDAKVVLADVSREALAVAKRNIERHGMGHRVSAMYLDAKKKATNFIGKFDMIVSNPPYVTGQEMLELEPGVRDFEPHMALDGGEDGLDFYRAIVENYTRSLKRGGYICFEFGMGQGDDVCRILEEKGYTILDRVRDYNDRERAVLAQYGRKED